ncbi:MAG: plastocyanin/azurin family copper-binding protein [Microthrixaceae bacterium]
MNRRTVGTLAAVLTLVVAGSAAGCGESDPGGSSGKSDSEVDLEGKDFADETGSDTVDVEAVDNNFRKPYIEVTKGATVTFTNDGRNVHDVVPVAEGAFPDIPAEDFKPDDAGSVTFDEVGDFAYYCTLHGTKTKGMVGGIRVVE